MDDTPDFDSPAPAEKPPKKPKPRPTRQKLRGRPVKKAARRVSPPAPPKQEVFLSDAVYKTIRTLVDLNPSEREMVFSIVKGLTK
jgi:hypothetical protein